MCGYANVFIFIYSPCSLVGFSQAYSTSQQCFPLTTNKRQSAQTSPETNQRTRRSCAIRRSPNHHSENSRAMQRVITHAFPLLIKLATIWPMSSVKPTFHSQPTTTTDNIVCINYSTLETRPINSSVA